MRDQLGKDLVDLSPVLILTGGLPAVNSQALFGGFVRYSSGEAEKERRPQQK